VDLRRLRHFLIAAEKSNFRRAALRLDTNQSIISWHVRDIEGKRPASPALLTDPSL